MPSSSRQASAISQARASSASMSTPIERGRKEAEGRERRVAAADRRLAGRRSPRTSARAPSWASAEPGSVIATHCVTARARASRSSRCASASRASSRTSTPRRRAFAPGRAALEVADRLRVGGVEDVEARRPERRAESPRARARSRPSRAGRPRRSRREQRARRAEQRVACSRIRAGSSSQPSQRASSLPVHTVGSRDQMRATSSRAFGASPRRQLAALGLDARDQLVERSRRTSATPSSSSVSTTSS